MQLDSLSFGQKLITKRLCHSSFGGVSVLLETLPFSMVSSHIETLTTRHRCSNHNYVSVQTTF